MVFIMFSVNGNISSIELRLEMFAFTSDLIKDVEFYRQAFVFLSCLLQYDSKYFITLKDKCRHISAIPKGTNLIWLN